MLSGVVLYLVILSCFAPCYVVLYFVGLCCVVLCCFSTSVVVVCFRFSKYFRVFADEIFADFFEEENKNKKNFTLIPRI